VVFGRSDLLGIVSSFVSMSHSDSVPSIIIPDERPAEQKCEDKTKDGKHDQYEKAKHQSAPRRVTTATNENSKWENQERSGHKTKHGKEKT
jgi:hypothetical protein